MIKGLFKCRKFRIFLSLFFGFQVSIFLTAFSQDIIVGIYDGTSTNVNSDFSAGVTTFTPTGSPCQLSADDLNAALAVGDVIIETTSGTATITPGTFSPTTANRSLTLKGSVNVFLSFIVGNTNLIHIIAEAGNDCTVNGPGIDSAGGDIEIHTENDINVTSSGIQAGGGSTKLYAGANVSISGIGIQAEAGEVKIHGQNINVNNGGIQSAGGDVHIDVEGDVSINGLAIQTLGGNIQIKARDLDLTQTGLQSGSGYIDINLSGDLTSSGKGIGTEGSAVTLRARSAFLSGTVIDTDRNFMDIGGAVHIELEFGITTTGFGIEAKNLYAKGNTYTADNGGITTHGGSVELNFEGLLHFFGHGIQTRGGNHTSMAGGWEMSGTGIRASLLLASFSLECLSPGYDSIFNG